jgi:DNA-binding NarL/FixJ family response regulator
VPITVGRLCETGAVVTRVLVVDDQALVRAGLLTVLGRADDLEVVGEAADGRQAVAAALRTRPDVVLMDVRMPVLDGLEATRQIMADERLAGVRVIMLTTFEIDEYLFSALRAGASGYLLKDVDPEELRQAVRVVAAGEALLAPSVTRRLITEFVSRAERPVAVDPRWQRLTEREREVVRLVARGLSNPQIAAELRISPATAKTHVNRAMTKLDARDRAQLVVLSYESGLD